MFGFKKKSSAPDITNNQAQNQNIGQNIANKLNNSSVQVKEEEDIFALAAKQEEDRSQDLKTSLANQLIKAELQTNQAPNLVKEPIKIPEVSLKTENLSSRKEELNEADTLLFGETQDHKTNPAVQSKTLKKPVEIQAQLKSEEVRKEGDNNIAIIENETPLKTEVNIDSAKLADSNQVINNDNLISPLPDNNLLNPASLKQPITAEENVDPEEMTLQETVPISRPNNYDPQIWVPQLIEVLREINKENSSS
jgi:hypothetical protein